MINQPGSIQGNHPLAGGFVLHRPEAHDDCPDAGHLEGTPHPEHALARRRLSDTGVACRQDRPLGPLQIQRRHLFRRQDARILTRVARRIVAPANASPASNSGFRSAESARDCGTSPPTARVPGAGVRTR